MNAFAKMVTVVLGRLAQEPQSNNIAWMATVSEQAEQFQEWINKAEQNNIRYPAAWKPVAENENRDASLVEISETIGRAMCRLDSKERQALVYWVLYEVAAHDAIEKMAAMPEPAAC